MLKGYRTIVFNAIMTLLMLIALWAPDQAKQLPDATDVNLLLDNAEALLLTVTTVGNIVLRAITTTPVFKKE